VTDKDEVTVHDLGVAEVEIRTAPSFSRRASSVRPRYVFWIIGTASSAQDLDRTFGSRSDALDAARQWLGLPNSVRLCMGCQRPATMNASLGPTCDDHYDDYAD
jgi:hypothetical protein